MCGESGTATTEDHILTMPHSPSPYQGALTREEVRRAIHFEHPPRVPLALMHLLTEGLRERDNASKFQVFTQTPEELGLTEELRRKARSLTTLMGQYPEDVILADISMPRFWKAPNDDPDSRWAIRGQRRPVDRASLDGGWGILPDYSRLDEFLDQLPNPDRPDLVRQTENARRSHPDQYIVTYFWTSVFERVRSLRGMTAAMMDFYDHPTELHRLLKGLVHLYKRWIERMADAGSDGVLYGDDLGSQHGPLFDPQQYREFIKPYHAEIVDCIHSNGMDAWMHSCGDVTLLLDDFIEIGVDVLHPVQAVAMDRQRVAEAYGDKLCFLMGLDVQRLLPFGSPQDIAEGAHAILDGVARPEGGLMLGAGNAITPEVTLDRIRAFWSSAWHAVRARPLGGSRSDRKSELCASGREHEYGSAE